VTISTELLSRLSIIFAIWIASAFTQDALGQVSVYTNQQYWNFFLKQKEIDTKYLFYSHKSGALETLYFLDSEKKLAISSDRSYMVLLDQSNLHMDTIQLDGPMLMEMPPVFAGSDLYFIGLKNITKLETEGSPYRTESISAHRKSELAFPFDDGVIGPDRKSVKNQNAFPAFKFYKDKKPVDLVKPLAFIEENDRDKVVPSVYNISFRYYETSEEHIIFPVDTQQLVRIDKKSKEVSYIKLPYEEGEVICYYFNDHIQNQSYVLKHHFNTNFMELYTLDNKKKELSFVKSISYFPEAIVNAGIYCRELDEAGSVNHFLIPINSL